MFDASSGDYWVLDEATRLLLEGFQSEGRLPLSAVTGRMGCSEGEGGELITQLSRSGLLVGWVDGRAVGLAALFDTAD